MTSTEWASKRSCAPSGLGAGSARSLGSIRATSGSGCMGSPVRKQGRQNFGYPPTPIASRSKPSCQRLQLGAREQCCRFSIRPGGTLAPEPERRCNVTRLPRCGYRSCSRPSDCGSLLMLRWPTGRSTRSARWRASCLSNAFASLYSRSASGR